MKRSTRIEKHENLKKLKVDTNGVVGPLQFEFDERRMMTPEEQVMRSELSGEEKIAANMILEEHINF